MVTILSAALSSTLEGGGISGIPRAALVLADVLKRADERAGDLAADADQSR